MEPTNVFYQHYVRLAEWEPGEDFAAGLNRMISEEESKSNEDNKIQLKEILAVGGSTVPILLFQVRRRL